MFIRKRNNKELYQKKWCSYQRYHRYANRPTVVDRGTIRNTDQEMVLVKTEIDAIEVREKLKEIDKALAAFGGFSRTSLSENAVSSFIRRFDEDIEMGIVRVSRYRKIYWLDYTDGAHLDVEIYNEGTKYDAEIYDEASQSNGANKNRSLYFAIFRNDIRKIGVIRASIYGEVSNLYYQSGLGVFKDIFGR